MKTSTRTVIGLAIGWASLLPQAAWAQAAVPPPPPPPAAPAQPAVAPAPPPPPPAPPPAPVTVTSNVTAPPVAPPEAEADKRAEGETDHDRVIGRFGVTYFDIASLPIANPILGGAGTLTSSTIAAPVVGIRYWLQRNLGIDVGVGLGFAGGSQESVTTNAGVTTDTTIDKLSTTGFAFHGGLPIAFAHGRHYSFLVIPELTFGVTSGTLKPTAPAAPPGVNPVTPPEQDLSGFLFDGGVRVGAEVHFGFIGIPELALQASVGLSYRRSVFKWKSDVNSASDGTSTFGTDVQSNPWAIFTNNISATYYF
jgi:hypothetical protein